MPFFLVHADVFVVHVVLPLKKWKKMYFKNDTVIACVVISFNLNFSIVFYFIYSWKR